MRTQTQSSDLRLLFGGNTQLSGAIVRNRESRSANISAADFPVAHTMKMNPKRSK
jgi:hypothetical protein